MSGIFALKGISPLETGPWLLIGWTQNHLKREGEKETETD